MKKFFKILMVLALLSGAALSCTKDYSKEIADVQKQNQDLQALVASLQNALNSTNATVSQLNSASDKQAADIAALASANAEAFATIVADHADDVAYLEGLITDLKAAGASELAAAVEGLKASIKAGDDKAAAATEEKIAAAIKACDEKAAKALADAVTTCKEDIAKLKEALEGKIADLNTTLTAALEAKAKALGDDIKKVEDKADANAKDIAEIEKTLDGIDASLEAYKTDIEANKTAIETNKTAIADAKKEIEAIKEQIKSLSARLTNIVAAPAKDVEIQTFKWGNIEKTTVNMNFIVAPTEAAKAVADGFKNGEVEVTLFINSGVTRAKARVDSCDYVIIPNKVEAAEDGIITISAIVDTTLADLTAEELSKRDGLTYDYYATLAVSGEDEVGPWQRVSDPVKPIIGGSKAISYAWYAGDKAVKSIGSIELESAVLGAKDSVVVVGTDLTIVKADWDWKSDEYKVEDIIAGYEPKFVIGSTAYSVDEFKTAFDLPDSLKITAPRFVGLIQAFTEPFEWGNDITVINKPADTDSTLFKATVKTDSTINSYGLNIVLPEKEADQVEAVGKATIFAAPKIAFGKVDTCDLGVMFVQRIGKHVEEEKAAEAQTLEFGIDGMYFGIASIGGTWFESLQWLSTTQLAVTDVYTDVYELNDGKLGKKVNATAQIHPNPANPKFVDLGVVLYYAKEQQKLRIVLAHDAQMNGADVAVLEHGDYIDLTVEPYHDAVSATYDAGEIYVPRKKNVKTTFTTDITVKNLFKDINDWLIKDAETDTDSAVVYDWFKNNAFTNAKYTVAPTNAVTAGLSVNAKDSICVTFTKGTKFVEGKPVTISVKDSIDKVIKFNYTVSFTPIKPEVKIATIPGFVKDGKVEVAGKEVNGKYTINDINLSQYFKFENVDKKHENDEISVKFSDDTTGLIYSGDSTYVIATGTKDAIQSDAKISWGALKATQFELTAQAQLEGEKVGEAVKVTVYTKDPIDEIADVKIEKVLKGKVAEIDLFKDLKIIGILDTKNSIYPSKLDVYDGVEPTIAEMKDWKCKVNDVDYPNDQMQQLFSGITGSVLSVKEHDALGTIVITIPCEFKYGFGKKEFNVILTIK